MTKQIFIAGGLALLLTSAAWAQDRPAGWQGAGCDPDQFSAVMTSGGAVAYWTNPTCWGLANSENSGTDAMHSQNDRRDPGRPGIAEQ